MGSFQECSLNVRDWYYLQAQTNMPFHYLKLVVWIFARFLQLMSMGLASLKTAAKQKETKYNFKSSSLREWFGIFFEPNQIFLKKSNLIRLCKVFIIKMWLYKGISLIVICSETIGNTLGTQAKIRTKYLYIPTPTQIQNMGLGITLWYLTILISHPRSYSFNTFYLQ